MEALTTFQVLTLLGIGSLTASFWVYIWHTGKKTASNVRAIKLGVQAVLRAQMIADYNHYKDKGYAPIYAKENFQNCWNQYEALGANGVMNHIYKEFMNLPTTPPEEE